MMSEYKLLIGGALVDGASTIDVINPSTEEILAIAPRASEAQLDQAVAAAKAAFPAWAATPIAERRKLVHQIADVIEAHADEFYRLLSLEVGRPIGESKEEVDYTVEFIRGLADLEIPQEVLHEDDFRIAVAERRPLGVVGAIIPWNFPILLVGFKAPSALLAGNTVVIKPAPTTPLATLRLGELLAPIFPAGVINIVTDANDLGPKLTAHPDVAKITFTGSCETGKRVMSAAAATMKRLTLELGGNDPAIIMPGVDLDIVADFIMYAGFTNAGQICNCIKRIYAHADIYDELVSKVADRCNAHVVGDVLDPATTLGPIHNKAQFERARSWPAVKCSIARVTSCAPLGCAISPMARASSMRSSLRRSCRSSSSPMWKMPSPAPMPRPTRWVPRSGHPISISATKSPDVWNPGWSGSTTTAAPL